MPKYSSRRRFQFTLVRLLVFVATIAALLGWFSAHQSWLRDRHSDMDWVTGQTRWNIANAPDKARLPWGLWAAGERFSLDFIEVEEKDIRPDDAFTVSELERLFPEATVKATPAGE